MRNLAEYPITYDEKIKLLENLHTEFMAEGRVGDIRPLLLSEIMEDLARLEDLRLAETAGWVAEGFHKS